MSAMNSQTLADLDLAVDSECNTCVAPDKAMAVGMCLAVERKYLHDCRYTESKSASEFSMLGMH